MLYKTLRLHPGTMEALRACLRPNESFDKGIQRLLGSSGHPARLTSEQWSGPTRRAPSKYAGLDTLQVGQTARLPWRGMRSASGAFEASQAAVYNAVTRAEKRTGFEFQRRDDGKGLRVTRIK